jgi:hypothetical protein
MFLKAKLTTHTIVSLSAVDVLGLLSQSLDSRICNNCWSVSDNLVLCPHTVSES